MMQQLNLSLDIKLDARMSDFAGESWVAIVDAVYQLEQGLLPQCYFYGESNTGKSHLLSAICDSFTQMGKKTICLSLRELLYTSTDMLLALENYHLIAIDDLDSIAANGQWQEAVFHLINRSYASGAVGGSCQLVFAAKQPPTELGLSMPDLVSRLSQAAIYELPSGNTFADREAALQASLARHGWQFDERIVAHLLANGPNKIGLMMQIIRDIQPLFAHVRQARLPKVVIERAIDMIDQQTLLFELENMQQQVQQDTKNMTRL